jgi:hypothetical protein
MLHMIQPAQVMYSMISPKAQHESKYADAARNVESIVERRMPLKSKI